MAALLVKRNNLNIDYQGHQVVRLYINGELWGVYNLREKKSKDYLASNYPGLDPKKVDILRFNGQWVEAGSADIFNTFFDYVKNTDFSSDANYQTLLTKIDEDNFLDYMVLMIYSGNRDWIENNTRWWREQKDGAKWRWMLDDVDRGFSRKYFDSFSYMLSGTKKEQFTSIIFNKLLLNPTFKQKFINRFNNYLDTILSPDNVKAEAAIIRDERRAYVGAGRFGQETTDPDQDYSDQSDFADVRGDYLRGLLNNL